MSAGPLAGIRVIDAATLLAGPLLATQLADFGAEVLKVEHPRGDSLRSFGWTDEGTSVYWKTAARNKRCLTLDLGRERGQELLRELAAEADVLIENFRPGTMERWGLGPERLQELNPRLVIVRVTGFGQDGPYSGLPGFGTLAEAMSGLASVLGDRDRPPIVPPLPAADTATALLGSFATIAALYERDAGGSGRGQVLDLNLLESMQAVMAPQVSAFDRLGVVPGRDGSQAEFSAPRGVYRSRDGRWLAISTSAQSVADRLLATIGVPAETRRERFGDNASRLEHREELDELLAAWIGARDAAEALDLLRAADVAVAPVQTAAEVAADPHLLAREALVRVPDGDDDLLMHAALPRFSRTPGTVREAGRELGADNSEVYSELLGLGPEELAELAAEGTI